MTQKMYGRGVPRCWRGKTNQTTRSSLYWEEPFCCNNATRCVPTSTKV